MGRDLGELGRYEEAIEAYKDVVELLRELRYKTPRQLRVLADSLNNLGQHLDNSRRHQEAIPLLEEALAYYLELLCKEPASIMDKVGRSTLLDNLAANFSALEIYGEAIRVCHEGVGLLQDFVPSHKRDWEAISILARLQMRLAYSEVMEERYELGLCAFLEGRRTHQRLAVGFTGVRGSHRRELARLVSRCCDGMSFHAYRTEHVAEHWHDAALAS